jgi:hypothetical protein
VEEARLAPDGWQALARGVRLGGVPLALLSIYQRATGTRPLLDACRRDAVRAGMSPASPEESPQRHLRVLTMQRGHTKQLTRHSVRHHAFFASPLIVTGTVIGVWKRRYRNEEFSFSRAMARAYRGRELEVALAVFGTLSSAQAAH